MIDFLEHYFKEAYGDVKRVNSLPGYEDIKRYYYIFPDGRVWSSYLCDFMHPSTTSSGGYLQVKLQMKDGSQRTFNVHQIQAAAKHGYTKPDGYHVRHINGDATDNSRSNVEYCLPAVNRADAKKHGKVGRHLSERAVQKIRLLSQYRSKRYGKGFSNRAIAVCLGTFPSTVSNIIKRRSHVDVEDLSLDDHEGMVWSHDSSEPEFWLADRQTQ